MNNNNRKDKIINKLNLINDKKIKHQYSQNIFDHKNSKSILYHKNSNNIINYIKKLNKNNLNKKIYLNKASISKKDNFFYKPSINESINNENINSSNVSINYNLGKNNYLIHKNNQNLSKIKINTNIENKTINYNTILNKEEFFSLLYKKRVLKKINNITIEASFPVHFSNYNNLYHLFKNNSNKKNCSSNNKIKIIKINNKTKIKKNNLNNKAIAFIYGDNNNLKNSLEI